MEVTAKYQGKMRFEVAARGHRIISDQPVSENGEGGGEDAGMTPPELLLASLASCAAYYAAQYLNIRKLPSDDLKARVTAEKAANPARLTSFQIEVTVGGLNERDQGGVLRSVKKCLIHNTLLSAPSIDVTVRAGALTAV